MSKGTLYDKVLDAHIVDELSKGRYQIFIDRHFLHEVTSPPAFGEIIKDGLTELPFPQLATATVDHIVPTDEDGFRKNPEIAKKMYSYLEESCKRFGIEFLGAGGIVHIIGPESGLTQPGITIVCGDSHTSTHGALGAVAWGIGTTQAEHVLRTQTVSHDRLKVRKINLNGQLPPGVEAKDIALNAIRMIGMKNGIGYAHEFSGPLASALTMEERMTICNLGIEGNARVTYFNPDETTYGWMVGRPRVPKGAEWFKALSHWKTLSSEKDADYDHVFDIDAGYLSPTVTWGTNPGQAVYINEPIPNMEDIPESERKSAAKALKYMKFQHGDLMDGKIVDMVFIGSCTNGRTADIQRAADVVKGYKANPNVKVILVPGSPKVKKECEEKGLDKVFRDAGIEWRTAGCSMCLGMNTDRAQGDVLVASTSNRNFEGRQGDTARTVLMSPAMAAYAAITGKIGDVRHHVYK